MSFKPGLLYQESKIKMIEKMSPRSSNSKDRVKIRQNEPIQENNILQKIEPDTTDDDNSKNCYNENSNSADTSNNVNNLNSFNVTIESNRKTNAKIDINLVKKNLHSMDVDDLSSDESYIDDKSSLYIKTKNESNEVTENNSNGSESDMKSSIKNIQLTHLSTDNKSNEDKMYSTVFVKVEITPYIEDTEYFNIYHRDTSGVPGCDVVSQNIIDSEKSIEAAMDDIRHGTLDENVYFECPHCHQFFNQPKRFLIHIKWHSFGKIRENGDNQELGRIERITRNRVIYSNKMKRKYTCTDCNNVYYTKETLRLHRQKNHPMGARDCKVCGVTLLSYIALRNHMSTHTGEVGYQCEHCPKLFKHWHSLSKHRGVHMEKTHSCPECPKKFGSQQLLRVHMRTHERALHGAKFKCTYCRKGFFASYNLQVHERSHRNERPFECEICHTSFTTKGKLQRHLQLSHSSAKPFECPTCHRSFISELMRDRHEMRVHGDPEVFKFPCKECPGRYLRLIDLKKHMYKLHPKRKRKVKYESE